jgi:uncharacterized protein YbcI
MEITKEQRAGVAEMVMQLEREFYGRGPTSVRVSVSNGDPEVITVLSIDTLTTMDRTLVGNDMISQVVAHHQAVHRATAEEFCNEIEDILGIRPSSYLAQVDPNTGYAVRVFVFAGADGGYQGDRK